MTKKLKYIILLSLLSSFLSSCGKEIFATKKVSEKSTSSPISHYQDSLCSNFTLDKPPVDILLLWDNSSSQFFINQESKDAFAKTVLSISAQFDYRMYFGPLIGSGKNDFWLLADNPSGLNASGNNALISPAQASSKISSFNTAPAGKEYGFQRSVDLLKSAKNDGIFRKKAYTIIVVMSNGDDAVTVEGLYSPQLTPSYVTQKKNKLLHIRDNILESLQMRFLTMVAHSSCGNGFTQGRAYKLMSSLIYSSPYQNSVPSPTDQDSSATPDSYNICTNNFKGLFSSINDSIKSVLVKHKYNRWPVTGPGSAPFDSTKIKVFKDGVEFPAISAPTPLAPDGFHYIGNTTANTRYEPSVGEPYSGHMIELFGLARVEYPECLRVQTESPVEYFGYIQLAAKPLQSSIVLKINGALIPESNANGWSYIGYQSSQNIKVDGPDINPSNPGNQASPEVNKTGYFIKLNGNAIMSNGASISVIFDPAS